MGRLLQDILRPAIATLGAHSSPSALRAAAACPSVSCALRGCALCSGGSTPKAHTLGLLGVAAGCPRGRAPGGCGAGGLRLLHRPPAPLRHARVALLLAAGATSHPASHPARGRDPGRGGAAKARLLQRPPQPGAQLLLPGRPPQPQPPAAARRQRCAGTLAPVDVFVA